MFPCKFWTSANKKLGSYCTFVDFGDGSPDPLDPVYPDPSRAAGAFKGSLQCGVYTPTNVISVSYGGQEVSVIEVFSGSGY